MSWAKLDDRLHDSSEFNGLSDGALAFWTRMQSRMAAMKTDGMATVQDFERLDVSRCREDREIQPWPALVQELQARGLLIPTAEGWQDTGWISRNFTTAEHEAETRWGSLRASASHAKKRGDVDLERQYSEAANEAKLEYWRIKDERLSPMAETRVGQHESLTLLSTIPSRPVPTGREGTGERDSAAPARPGGRRAPSGDDGAPADAGADPSVTPAGIALAKVLGVDPDEITDCMRCGVLLTTEEMVEVPRPDIFDDYEFFVCPACRNQIKTLRGPEGKDRCIALTKPGRNGPGGEACSQFARPKSWHCHYHQSDRSQGKNPSIGQGLLDRQRAKGKG